MSKSRIRKIKTEPPQMHQQSTDEVFYMSLAEAKQAIIDKYEFLADRYETKYPKHKNVA